MADQAPPEDPQAVPNHRTRNILIALLVLVLAAVLAGGGYLLGRGKTTPTASATPSATASATASSTATATAKTTPTTIPTTLPTAAASCPPAGLTHPLDPLGPGTGSDTGVGGTGCNEGTVPADGTPFSVPAGWGLSSSATCTGSAGAGGMGDTLDFTAHNTDTNTDLAPVQNAGPWSYDVQSGGAGDGSTAPAGHYIIRVSRPNPTVNQCQWKIEVYRGLGH